MDHTPISAGRVLLGFSLTAIVAMVPLVYLVFGSHPVPDETGDGYRGVVLGIGSIVTMAVLIMLTVVAARRVVRRPSRA